MIFVFGVGTGMLLVIAFKVIFALATPNDGYLRIDRSDSVTDPYLFLEIRKPVDELSKKKSVTFEVKNENFLDNLSRD